MMSESNLKLAFRKLDAKKLMEYQEYLFFKFIY